MWPIPVDFNCRVCGKECNIAPNPPEQPVCEDHCPDHEYVHDPGVGFKCCEHCGKSEPYDWR